MTYHHDDYVTPEEMFGALLTCVALLLLPTMALSITGIGSPSQGEYTGQVLEVEQNTFIWTTHSVKLRSAYESSETESFCIPKDRAEEMKEKLRQSLENGKRVTVSHGRGWMLPSWKCGEYKVISSIRGVN